MNAAQLALAAATIFAVNLLPAFGPPTWAVLVFFTLNFDLPAAPLVAIGALAAASGRFVLANGARRLRPRLSAARLDSLDRAQRKLSGNRRRAAAGLGLFALDALTSPLGMALQLAMLVALALLAGGIRPQRRPRRPHNAVG